MRNIKLMWMQIQHLDDKVKSWNLERNTLRTLTKPKYEVINYKYLILQPKIMVVCIQNKIIQKG